MRLSASDIHAILQGNSGSYILGRLGHYCIKKADGSDLVVESNGFQYRPDVFPETVNDLLGQKKVKPAGDKAVGDKYILAW